MADLDAGDAVAISVSHQIRINGDDAWVKLEAHGTVRLNETADEAVDRVNKIIQRNIINIIKSSAQTVMDYEATG